MEESRGINQYLSKNEKVLWNGYPQTNFIFTIWDMLYFLFGVLCAWPLINKLLSGKCYMFEVVIITIFIAFIIFFFMFGRILMRYYTRKRTIYFVTSERVIIFNRSKNKIVKEQDIKSIKYITKKVGRYGIGRVEFGKITIAQLVGGNSGFDELAESKFAQKISKINTYFDDGADQWIPVFYDIKDVEYVYDLVNGLKKRDPTESVKYSCNEEQGL